MVCVDSYLVITPTCLLYSNCPTYTGYSLQLKPLLLTHVHTCLSRCGVGPQDGDVSGHKCYCDTTCSKYGDCCDDFLQFCEIVVINQQPEMPISPIAQNNSARTGILYQFILYQSQMQFLIEKQISPSISETRVRNKDFQNDIREKG